MEGVEGLGCGDSEEVLLVSVNEKKECLYYEAL
jgi:hypothetical protein